MCYAHTGIYLFRIKYNFITRTDPTIAVTLLDLHRSNCGRKKYRTRRITQVGEIELQRQLLLFPRCNTSRRRLLSSNRESNTDVQRQLT